MSFLYPRTIAIHRPGAQTGEGKLPYGGAQQATETEPLQKDVPCNIQLRREGQRNSTGLPGDGTRPTYDVRFPRGVLELGDVKDRDVVVDDLGARYLVQSDYWDSFGYSLRVERLEA